MQSETKEISESEIHMCNINDKYFAHYEEENVELYLAYQAIQGGIAEQENKVDWVHVYEELLNIAK